MAVAIRRPFRVLARLATFVGVTGTGWMEHVWRLRRRGLGRDPQSCARWVHRWSRRTLSALGIRCEHRGEVPRQGVVVCNHLSYLDIPVLAVSGPMVFVAKADVASWPLLGSLARCAGTLFLRREQRSHVAEVAAAFGPIVDGGTVVTIFPEGTSSGGETVLPFRPSLLEPAAAAGWPVTPAWITYEVGEGTVADNVAYWRDMTFAPHFFNLLAQRHLVGRVHFGKPVAGIADRKELARRLHAEVCALKAGSGSSASD